MSRLPIVPGLLAFWLMGAAAAPAQVTQASLNGLVVDSTGQPVPACAVVLVHDETGQQRTSATDGQGVFRMAGLPTGLHTVTVDGPGFKPFRQPGLRLMVGETADVRIQLEIAAHIESVTVGATAVSAGVSMDARLANTFGDSALRDLPLPQRDAFLLPKMNAGATVIPGAASSTKLTSSPVITVNGNRYRGNNYVLDGSMNSNPNNSGEPAIVPSLEAIEGVQVQTLNFASEFGRGNGAVVNMQTRSGTNDFQGRAWEYHRNDALNARSYFAAGPTPQQYHQFGATLGGPLRRNRTFFFGSYEGTRNTIGRPYTFQVETPELRDYVFRTAPSGVAARLLREFPAPTPQRGADGSAYVDQRVLTMPDGTTIPAIGRAAVTLDDDVRFDQYLVKIDQTIGESDRFGVRWIAEHQRDQGGTSSSMATLGRAMRGSRGPFSGLFGNLNAGYVKVGKRAVNDLRFSYQLTDATRGTPGAVVPTITITGLTAPFGDVFDSGTRLTTFEARNVLTLDRGKHAIRVGAEVRRITKDLSIGPPTSGSFTFNSLTDFVLDRPFRQNLTVDPITGERTGFPRHFTQFETGAFIQDQWAVTPRLSLSLGLRHDYFGTVGEREGRLSSIVLGSGETFTEQLANASVGRVDRLYAPERLNFSPRIGIAWDPAGHGRMSVRAGFSMAYQPHHGQSISGARALPPDAIEGVIQPSTRIGTQILYDIPVPFNPEFARGLNDRGGVLSPPGEAPIRATGFVVNPTIKTQYTEGWFLNTQRRFGAAWTIELGYIGTRGVNLERIDDVNRFSGDLLDGREDRINPNFGVLLFVTNGVTSSYHAFTAEIRREMRAGLSFQANYRWSKWLDTSSDTSTGQFQDNAEPGKGAQNAACLRCERAPSLFDVPHRLSIAGVWAPAGAAADSGVRAWLTRGWQLSGILTAQSGRPFSVWNGAAFGAGGDYNADGGGGAVGGGYYDRPDAPAPGAIGSAFSTQDFLTGLFAASVFPRPAPGQSGTLGRNTFRGPRYITLDLSLARSLPLGGKRELQFRGEAFNALNTLNLFLPNADLSVANFGKSTQSFDARVIQLGLRFLF
jgi:hypothetical protein